MSSSLIPDDDSDNPEFPARFSLSYKSDAFNVRGIKLEKEKGTLEARVRELEGNLRQLSSPAPTAAATTPSRHRAARRRSSSVSDTRITTLEQDVKDRRASLAHRETELRGAAAKLAQAQTDLENEKLASDKRLHAEAIAEQLLSSSAASQDAMNTCQRLQDVQVQLGVAAQGLDAMTRQRDELLAKLALKESEWMGDDPVADLEAAQREVAEAETRYSALQFQQLNSMMSNEATQMLRKQLADQEDRVLRRTELVGILQHESKRLETNLKLQEDRRNEMTTELEARDAAIARVEDLEMDVETLEGSCAIVG
ncbi:hypothetical protein K438DRAFT_1960888 [Mycena galopus ATCC 62051]|nr:hypothetical protein K438DRAFT_1960888 [Mycena galopus ATCC 62051]